MVFNISMRSLTFPLMVYMQKISAGMMMLNHDLIHAKKLQEASVKSVSKAAQRSASAAQEAFCACAPAPAGVQACAGGAARVHRRALCTVHTSWPACMHACTGAAALQRYLCSANAAARSNHGRSVCVFLAARVCFTHRPPDFFCPLPPAPCGLRPHACTEIPRGAGAPLPRVPGGVRARVGAARRHGQVCAHARHHDHQHGALHLALLRRQQAHGRTRTCGRAGMQGHPGVRGRREGGLWPWHSIWCGMHACMLFAC